MIDSGQFILTTVGWLKISDYLALALLNEQPPILMMDPSGSGIMFGEPTSVKVRIEESDWIRLVAREVSIRVTMDQPIISGGIGESWTPRKAKMIDQTHFFCGIVPSLKVVDFQMRDRIMDPTEPVTGVVFECPDRWVHIRGTMLSSGIWIPCL